MDEDDFIGFEADTTTDTDFFADVVETSSTEEEEISEIPETTTKEEEEEEEVENLFAPTPEETEEEEEETPEGGDSNGETSVSISTLNYLKDNGVVEFELEEGEELTDERASEVLEDSLDNMFEEKIGGLFEDMPPLLKDLNKFVIKGGDLNDFLQKVSLQNETGVTKGLDLTVEANQVLMVKAGLKGEEFDDEYIEAQVEFLKDSGRLQKHSEAQYARWEKENDKETAAVLLSKENDLKADKIKRRAAKNKVVDFLKETEEVSGFVVTKQDQRLLPTYMSDRTVKLEDGRQITSMQKDLMRVLNSPTGAVQMAKLLKAVNDKGELDFKEITQNTETKVTKKVREDVRRRKGEETVTSKEAKYSKKKSLADYFND